MCILLAPSFQLPSVPSRDSESVRRGSANQYAAGLRCLVPGLNKNRPQISVGSSHQHSDQRSH